MATKFIQAEIKEIDLASRRIVGYAYPPRLDRDSETVLPTAFTEKGLANFRKKPTLTWCHKYDQLPLGVVTQFLPTDQGPKAEAVLLSHPQAEEVWKIFKQCKEAGIPAPLGLSIGFNPITSSRERVFPGQHGLTFTEVEMIELAVVPVQSNPEALAAAKSKGIDLAPIEKALKELGERGRAQLTGLRAIVQAILDGEGDPIEYAREASWSLNGLLYRGDEMPPDDIEIGLMLEANAHLHYILGEEGLPEEHAQNVLDLFAQLRADAGSFSVQEASKESRATKATWTRAYINDLPDSAFLFIESGGEKNGDGKTKPRGLRHFPYKNAQDKIDLPHLRNAIARIPQAKIPGLDAAGKEKLQEKARKILEDETGEKSAGATHIHSGVERTQDAETQIKILRSEALNRIEQLRLRAKEGRVLSTANRGLLRDSIKQLNEAVQAMQALLDATEPEPEKTAPAPVPQPNYESMLTEISAELKETLRENAVITANVSALLRRGFNTHTRGGRSTESLHSSDGGSDARDHQHNAGER